VVAGAGNATRDVVRAAKVVETVPEIAHVATVARTGTQPPIRIDHHHRAKNTWFTIALLL